MDLCEDKTYTELRTRLQESFPEVFFDDKTQTLYCPEAQVLLVNGEKIPMEDLTTVYVCFHEYYYDKHDNCLDSADKTIRADIIHGYSENEEYPTIYDWDYTDDQTSLSVYYIKDGKEVNSSVYMDGSLDRPRKLINYVLAKAGQ